MISSFEGVPTTQGEVDPSGIYAAVGGALSRWEDLEFAIANIFPRLISEDLNSRAYQICRKAIGRLENSSTRADIVSATLETFFEFTPSALSEPARDLFREIGRARSFRNKLAHGVARDYRDDGGSFGWWLMSSSYDTKRRDFYNGEAWHVSLEHIREFHEETNKLFSEVVALYMKLPQL